MTQAESTVEQCKEMAMPCSVIELMSPGDKGMCAVKDLLYSDFTAVLLTAKEFRAHNATLIRLREVCKNLPADCNFKPKPGDLVAALSPTGGWLRAIVLSEVGSTYHVAFCDNGVSQKLITEVRKLPESYCKIPRFGVRISIRKFNIDEREFRGKFLKLGSHFRFTVTETDKERHRAILTFGKSMMELCEVEISEWQAKWEDRGLRCVGLRNGEMVTITSYSSVQMMYVRPMAQQRDRRWKSLCQEVAAHCFFANYLNEVPDRGELVACKYLLDGAFYRALVMGYKGKKIRVCYVDVGSTEYVQLNQLKQLSQQLKEVPCQAVCVRLNKVSPQPMTVKAVLCLSYLLSSSATLKLDFCGSYSRQGVELLLNKKPLSAKINEHLIPDWKLAIDDGKNPAVPVLMSKDIFEVKLPLDEPFRLTTMTSMSPGVFFGCPSDNGMSHYNLTELHKSLAAYCEATPAKCYVPRNDEVCIVKCSDGRWYRATCITQPEGTLVCVRLLDFGHLVMVQNVDIRKMCEDFIWFDAVAVLCVLDCLPTNVSDDLACRLKELLPSFSHHEATVVKKTDDEYIIRIPEVEQILRRERFI